MKIRLSISLTYIDAQSQFTLRLFRLVYVKSRRLKLDAGQYITGIISRLFTSTRPTDKLALQKPF